MIKNNLAGMEIIADRQKIPGLARYQISLNENPPNEEPNYSDIVYTDAQYYLVMKKYNRKLKHDVPEKYIIGCDIFKKKFMRVKNWADFMRIVQDPNAINHKAALWVYRNTQLEERMFLLIGEEEGMRIQFTLNTIEYVMKLAKKANKVPSMEMLFNKNLLEINRERAQLS